MFHSYLISHEILIDPMDLSWISQPACCVLGEGDSARTRLALRLGEDCLALFGALANLRSRDLVDGRSSVPQFVNSCERTAHSSHSPACNEFSADNLSRSVQQIGRGMLAGGCILWDNSLKDQCLSGDLSVNPGRSEERFLDDHRLYADGFCINKPTDHLP